MDDLRDLYQEIILDHGKRPRNFSKLEGPRVAAAEGYNPLCGDQITLYLDVEGDVIRDAGFQGSGCAISTASASMMTAAVKGKTRGEVQRLFASFHGLVTGEGEPDEALLGKLAVFAGVSEFPMRVKCASLPWHTLHAALEGKSDGPVSTE
ncbi:MAG TPA: SUF system NifU family Fe-S cluster assembly protein [Thermodesulfobacteriota bacterium]